MGWGLVMPAPLSRDLRERIVEAIEGGSSMRGAAARFAVSPSSAIKLMARVRATGSVAPARYGGYRRPVLAPHEDVLRALVAAQPDITLAEIQAELGRQRGIRVCLATIHVRLRRLGLRRRGHHNGRCFFIRIPSAFPRNPVQAVMRRNNIEKLIPPLLRRNPQCLLRNERQQQQTASNDLAGQSVTSRRVTERGSPATRRSRANCGCNASSGFVHRTFRFAGLCSGEEHE